MNKPVHNIYYAQEVNNTNLIMTQRIKINVQYLQEIEVRGGREWHFTTSIKNLVEAVGNQESFLKWSMPLTPNVRRPSKNSVIASIVDSLAQNPLTSISSPIHLACGVFLSRSKNSSKNYVEIELVFGTEEDGVLDGAHRILAFIIAYNLNIDLSQATVNIIAYAGLSPDILKEKAIGLNTSKAVSTMSLANYRGDFDYMKNVLGQYRVLYYEGEEGKFIASVDGCCAISRICQLVLMLDCTYSPASIDGKKRHPIAFAKSGNMHIRKDYSAKLAALFPIVHEVISLQSQLFLLVEKRHKSPKSPSPFTRDNNDPRKRTKLPTHQTLSCVVKIQSFVYPIISSFRSTVCVKEGNPYIMLSDEEREVVLKRMLDRYIELVGQSRYKGQSTSIVFQDTYIWDEMSKIMETYLKEIGDCNLVASA